MKLLDVEIFSEMSRFLVELTVCDAVEAVLVNLEAVRTEARGLGRVRGQPRRRHADVGAAAVQGKAVVRPVRLAIRVVDVDDHRNLFLKNKNKNKN